MVAESQDEPSSGEGRRWFGGILAAFLASLLLGWLLPNGLNEFSRLTGQEEIPTTPLVHFFCFAMAFFLTLGTELLLWSRRHTADAIESITRAVKEGLATGTAAAMKLAVVRSILPHHDADAAQTSRSIELLTAYADVLATIPQPMLNGYSVLVEDGLARMESDLRSVASTGLEVNIQRHVEITRRLTAEARSFLQINRKSFLVPDEWTQEWLDLVDELGARAKLEKHYTVLMGSEDLRRHRDEIAGMAAYLDQRGWQLSTCSLEKVSDGLGSSVPTMANLDVYDGRFAKLQSPPEGRYRGGVRLEMTLVELDRRPELRRFINAVVQYATPVG
jgi:hypothetical protein